MTGEEFLDWLQIYLSSELPALLQQPATAPDPWWLRFITSSGFAGLFAVIASIIAFVGVRYKARLDAWWQRAEWGLNKATDASSSPRGRAAGYTILLALQDSRLAGRKEQRLLNEVTAILLDSNGDGDETDDIEETPKARMSFRDRRSLRRGARHDRR